MASNFVLGWQESNDTAVTADPGTSVVETIIIKDGTGEERQAEYWVLFPGDELLSISERYDILHGWKVYRGVIRLRSGEAARICDGRLVVNNREMRAVIHRFASIPGSKGDQTMHQTAQIDPDAFRA